MNKPVLLTGIKPTGDLHIGNYFGALKPTVDLVTQNDTYQPFVMVADYHALNTMQNKEEMRRLTLELVMAYMACGLDPEKVTLFKQSDVPAHTELAWIFDTITPVPYLMLAHAFKAAVDKAYFENNPDPLNNLRNDGNESETFRELVTRVFKGVNVGTFNYPMLMAADILLYDTAIVPVGQDQKQHIEYARDTAEKFNRIYGDTFSLPKESIMPDVAIVPGTDGQKMSKSYGNTIPLFGSREDLTKAVMSIVTDSSGNRPENVYAIHKLIKSEAELAELYDANAGSYKILKEALIEDLDTVLSPMREKYEELRKNPDAVYDVLKKGGEVARAKSEEKMAQVRTAIGVS